jgi:hypothetical protein
MKGASVFLISWTTIAAASAQVDWDLVSPYPSPVPLASVAFGSGRFVAAGAGSAVATASGALIYSDDGVSWRSGTSETEEAAGYSAVVFADGKFVAAGSAGQVSISTNGMAWQTHNLPVAGNFLTLLFGNGLFVATADNGAIAASPDGYNWNVTTNASTAALGLSAFGNGTFLVAETGSFYPWKPVFLKSSDGTNWVRSTAQIPGADPNCFSLPPAPPCQQFDVLTGLAFGNGQFVAAASYGLQPAARILVSNDGEAWMIKGPALTGGQQSWSLPPNKLFAVDGQFVFMNPPQSSPDLENWTPLPLPYIPPDIISGGLLSIARGGTNFVLAGDAAGTGLVLQGPDLAHLERIDSPLKLPTFRSTAVSQNVIVAVGESSAGQGPIAVSTNTGRSFQSVTAPSGVSSLQAIKEANGKFIAVGAGGAVVRSTNGLTWSKRLSNTTSDLNDVVFGAGIWVAVGTAGRIIGSADGETFLLKTSPTEVTLRGVAYGDNRFVAVGDSGAILTSTNGDNWNVQGTADAQDLYGVAFGGGFFVAVGTNGVVYRSTNAVAWTASVIPGTTGLNRVSAGDLAGSSVGPASKPLFVATEPGSNRAFTSKDGVTWQSVPFARVLAGTDSSNGNLFVSGERAYIAEARAGSPAGIIISAALKSGLFTLDVDAPSSGDFRILSSTVLGAPWNTEAILTNMAQHFEWSDTNAMRGTRFYEVQRQ